MRSVLVQSIVGLVATTLVAPLLKKFIPGFIEDSFYDWLRTQLLGGAMPSHWISTILEWIGPFILAGIGIGLFYLYFRGKRSSITLLPDMPFVSAGLGIADHQRNIVAGVRQLTRFFFWEGGKTAFRWMQLNATEGRIVPYVDAGNMTFKKAARVLRRAEHIAFALTNSLQKSHSALEPTAQKLSSGLRGYADWLSEQDGLANEKKRFQGVCRDYCTWFGFVAMVYKALGNSLSHREVLSLTKAGNDLRSQLSEHADSLSNLFQKIGEASKYSMEKLNPITERKNE